MTARVKFRSISYRQFAKDTFCPASVGQLRLWWSSVILGLSLVSSPDGGFTYNLTSGIGFWGRVRLVAVGHAAKTAASFYSLARRTPVAISFSEPTFPLAL